MLCIAKASFTSSAHGNVSTGDEIDVPHNLAVQWIAAGMVDPVKKPETAAKPLSSSPAGQASQNGRSTTYEIKPEPLAPTPVSAQSRRGKSVTPATSTGGSSTTKKQKGTKAGQPARKQPRDTG